MWATETEWEIINMSWVNWKSIPVFADYRRGMAPLKLNLRMATSRSTSQESSSDATATLIDYSQAPQSASQSFARTGKLLSTGIQSTTTITGSSSPSMESFEENQLARGDRSALLQNDSFYPSHPEQIGEWNLSEWVVIFYLIGWRFFEKIK